LKKISGVDDVDIDIRMQKVTVMGWADQKKVLKTVRKSGRRAELWPYPYNSEYHALTRHYSNNYGNNSYFASPKPFSSYNYYKHGYSYGEDFGYDKKPIGATMMDEKVMSMFSDDNPHACSIMWNIYIHDLYIACLTFSNI